MQQGDRQAARRWAEKAAMLAPEAEEPWLILAALANPRASVKYLERALKINPQSQRARKGMHWAVERLRNEQAGSASKVQAYSGQVQDAGKEANSVSAFINRSISACVAGAASL